MTAIAVHYKDGVIVKNACSNGVRIRLGSIIIILVWGVKSHDRQDVFLVQRSRKELRRS